MSDLDDEWEDEADEDGPASSGCPFCSQARRASGKECRHLLLRSDRTFRTRDGKYWDELVEPALQTLSDAAVALIRPRLGGEGEVAPLRPDLARRLLDLRASSLVDELEQELAGDPEHADIWSCYREVDDYIEWLLTVTCNAVSQDSSDDGGGPGMSSSEVTYWARAPKKEALAARKSVLEDARGLDRLVNDAARPAPARVRPGPARRRRRTRRRKK